MAVPLRLVVLTLCLMVPSVLGAECSCNQQPDNTQCRNIASSKFPDKVITKARVDGRCVYGLDHTASYSDARAFCEENGMRLVQLPQTCQQRAVFVGLGQSYQQHWVGLEKSNSGTWQWVSKNSLADANIPDSRWENAPDAGISSNTRSYTQTTLNQEKFHLKPVQVTAEYRPVCEDSTCSGRGCLLSSLSPVTSLVLVLTAVLLKHNT